jgi:hypothetical protein
MQKNKHLREQLSCTALHCTALTESCLSHPPRLRVRHALLQGFWDLDALQDDVARPPGLGVEHVEGEELVLHAQEHHLRARLQRHALVPASKKESKKAKARAGSRSRLQTHRLACASPKVERTDTEEQTQK